jgi:hypothetical protein
MVIRHMHDVCVKRSWASWSSMKGLVKDQVEGGASWARLHAGLVEGEAETRTARYRRVAWPEGRRKRAYGAWSISCRRVHGCCEAREGARDLGRQANMDFWEGACGLGRQQILHRNKICFE